ncbi:SpoVA/SpoVAEb family sporulation membrane protein, partial [Bacillus sp. HC-Mk]
MYILPPTLRNCIKAFLVGGLICTVGEVLMKFYIHYFHFSEQEAGNPTVATLVLLSAILTGCGVYDKIGQFAGAGSAVPVTGFANIDSSKLDFEVIYDLVWLYAKTA